MDRPKLKKNLVAGTVVGLFTLALLELGSCGLYFLAAGEGFSYGRVFRERAEIAADPKALADPSPEEAEPEAEEMARTALTNRQQVLHPFLGYVVDPGRPKPRYLRVTPLGFYEEPGNPGPEPAPDEEALTVGFFGGSVAMIVSFGGRKTLVQELEASPALAGRPVRVRSFALGGYKQPQQLMALALLLNLGEKLDVVVNLDGFNDVVLPQVDNARFGVFPFYPRSWLHRVDAAPDPRRQRLVGRVEYMREARRDLARSFASTGPVRYSVTWNLLWKALDRRAEARITEADAELAAYEPAKRSFLTHGPEFAYPDDEAKLKDFAAFWARSSLQMHRLAEANGIRYFHFLQPNQYVPDSKPLTAEERRDAFRRKSPYARMVRQGYPLLAERGEWLREQGVAFYDLRMLFAGIEETIYADACCHVNAVGNRLLAEAIAAAIRADLEGEGAPR